MSEISLGVVYLVSMADSYLLRAFLNSMNLFFRVQSQPLISTAVLQKSLKYRMRMRVAQNKLYESRHEWGKTSSTSGDPFIDLRSATLVLG